MQRTLTESTKVAVRFNEADPLGIVWHGHYIRYFEDGREAFGAKYGLTYLDFYKNGLLVPIVSVDCKFKKPLRYGDSVVVETTYLEAQAAKIQFQYKLFHAESGELVASGQSMQVFLDSATNQLLLNNPPFFESWKTRQGFISDSQQ